MHLQVRCVRYDGSEGGPVYGSGKGFVMPASVVLNVFLTFALALALLIGFIATARTRRESRRARAGFVSILDTLGFGFLLLREDGTVQDTSSLGADILQRREAQITGRHAHQLLHEGALVDQPGATCGFEVALRQHETYRGPERFADGHGQPIPVTVISMPLAGDRQGTVAVFRDSSIDIAQGRQREEALALVSHELRSPLTAVVGYSARLRAAVASGALPVDVQYGEEITLLAREAQRMREIILLILDTAEIDRGQLGVEVEPVRFNRLVQAEIDRVCLERPTAHFVLTARDDVVVESDQRYVRRIIQNLLENAAKFGGDTEPIEVTLKQDEDGGCCLTVRDHGAGVPAEAQPRIFERFYRHESAAAHGRGLGLGLYLSQQLASRLGGQLTFTSTPGEGATVSLVLPAVCPEDAPVMPQEQWTAADALFHQAPPTRL